MIARFLKGRPLFQTMCAACFVALSACGGQPQTDDDPAPESNVPAAKSEARLAAETQFAEHLAVLAHQETLERFSFAAQNEGGEPREFQRPQSIAISAHEVLSALEVFAEEPQSTEESERIQALIRPANWMAESAIRAQAQSEVPERLTNLVAELTAFQDEFLTADNT